MAKVKRTFTITQLAVNDIADLDKKEALLHLFAELERAREEEVRTSRVAECAYRDAQVIAAKALEAAALSAKLQAQFLEQTGVVFPMVAQELQWVPFRDEDGNVKLESVFTRRDQRNLTRIQKANMEAAASGQTDLSKFFEQEEDENAEERHVGFGAPAAKRKELENE